ncbi:hypothetical protein CMI47_11965 [Candidatus Pacearchaeota archaeon]|nr:hypothetical protein [Candidatus Pacearchaeota archaeon]
MSEPTHPPETQLSPTQGQNNKVGQEQIHDLLFSDKLSWQSIIYDLINTEQLDVWDLDLSVLTDRFLEKVRELEEADFFVSSKVLLAASLLLRIKSEILLNNYLPDLDAVLFGKEEDKKYTQERIELDDEIPDLVPRSPLPRTRKVSLQELMAALGKAIKTENRRIERVVVAKRHEMETQISLPRKRMNIKDEIRNVYEKLKGLFSQREQKLAFSELAGKGVEEKVATFVPLLHLDNQRKVFLEQEGHFKEIWVWMQHHYDKKHAALLDLMKKEVEEEMVKMEAEMSEEEKVRADDLENKYSDPLGELG